MPPARILVQLLDGETIVHEYQRVTTMLEPDSLQKLCLAAVGWLQAYGSQANREQWEMELRKALHRD